ncbi:MAG: hypothetical protein KAR40_06030 [Candidatus Sabulitectum sp.]|nr:hypothetical protein [Candidatus Sabulitectum sp.]
MAFTNGSATDYRDLLLKLDLFITNKHLSVVAVNAGGSSYIAGDILTVAGGTVQGSMTAQIEVLTVDGGGAVLTARVSNSGAYSVDPTVTANAVTGGTGSSATMDLTMLITGWTQRMKNLSSAPITSFIEINEYDIIDDGSGYGVGDTITWSAPGATTAATFLVASVISGNVTSLSIVSHGTYTAITGSTYGTTTGGSGTGLTLQCEFRPVRDEYFWEGSGTGGNSVYVGIRTAYAVADEQVSWELAGFTGWQSGQDWENQAGITDGRCVLATSGEQVGGPAVLLETSAMDYWIYANTRRIIMVIHVGASYQSLHMGLCDPFGTDTEIPYPMYICGTSDKFTEDIGDGAMWLRGPSDPMQGDLVGDGNAGLFRDGAGVWNKVRNGYYDGSDITSDDRDGYWVYPCGSIKDEIYIAIPAIDDFVTTYGLRWEDIIKNTRSGTPSYRWKPSPDSGGNKYFPIPCTVMLTSTDVRRAVAEVNGVFWVSAEEGLSVNDRIINSGRYFRVFQMGANAVSYSHFCVEEK